MIHNTEDSVSLYLEYINKELYKSRYSLLSSYNFNKLSFINKINNSSFWFPANSGFKENLWVNNKLRSKKKFHNNSIYLHDGFVFLPTFEIFINCIFEVNYSSISKSSIFQNYLNILNESVRKTDLKKNIQKIVEERLLKWKYSRSNNYAHLYYYYNFEPHRSIIRLRKLNFVAVNSWFPLHKKKWLFARRNMRNFYLRHRRVEQFEFVLMRFKGMSFEYWAKQQLQYNYLNFNSSDLMIDPKSSVFFKTPQASPTKFETDFLFNNQSCLYFVYVLWVLKESISNSSISSLPSFFSNTYNSNQVSISEKVKYFKNFFSSTTPKYAHVHFDRLDDGLDTHFSFFKPSYWNLKKGLDSYPHEHWAWIDVLWWEEHVPLYFSRFNHKRREEVFPDLDILDSSNLNWFYKSWFHEEIFTEFQASYYKTYYNIDYLTPGWRIQTDFPVKLMGHYDPYWHERLYEYVLYPYMELFYPSTKRYYIDYFKHPSYIDSRSFLVLNFAWKLSNLSLFIYKFRPKFRKILRSKQKYINPHDNLKPDFKQLYNDSHLINFLPLISMLDLKVIKTIFNLYQKNLVFLLNVFTKNDMPFEYKAAYIDYLFYFLNSLSIALPPKNDFIKSFSSIKFCSYSTFANILENSLFISSSEFLNCKERVVVEYVAFKRFYSLLISEYGNTE